MISKKHKSPNFNARRGGAVPSMIVLHYTGMKTGRAALDRLCDPAAEVSAHYFIDEAGAVTQLVEDDHRAWHAGAAHWAGESDINSHSIGVELVNPGHEFGYRPFPEKQVTALVALCKVKIEGWGVSPARILGHSDIAPSRKADPGELFPWERLANEGVGFWPAPQEMDYEAAADILSDQGALHALFVSFGYNVVSDPGDIITAFHRHFYPEKFGGGAPPGAADEETVARLLSLLRLGHDASN